MIPKIKTKYMNLNSTAYLIFTVYHTVRGRLRTGFHEAIHYQSHINLAPVRCQFDVGLALDCFVKPGPESLITVRNSSFNAWLIWRVLLSIRLAALLLLSRTFRFVSQMIQSRILTILSVPLDNHMQMLSLNHLLVTMAPLKFTNSIAREGQAWNVISINL